MICRVLVVEDHEMWRARIRAALQDHPRWQIAGEAIDGIEALQKAKSLKPDLVLLDIGLPVLNGIVAARQILSADPQINILFFSGYQFADIVVAALRIGAKGYLLKSDAAQLVPAMDAVMEGKRYISEGLGGEFGAMLPDAQCPRCRIWLFSAKIAPADIPVPPSADYVCVNCGLAFKGKPPVLEIVRQLPL